MAFSKSQRHDVCLLAVFRSASYLGDTIALIALFLRLSALSIVVIGPFRAAREP